MSQSKLQQPGVVVLMSIEGLPSDILLDVFLKLPLKSLARARWTCKRWHAIISDPIFVEKHWKYSIKHYPGFFYRFGEDPNIYYIESNRKVSSIGNNNVEGDLDNCVESIRISYGSIGQELTSYLPHLFDEYAKVRSARGLFAFIMASEKCCCICNPIIGEHIKVPIDPLFCDEDHKKGVMYWWALGYSPMSKVYKIIVLQNEFRQGVCIGLKSIYTLGSGSTWRMLPDNFPIAHCSFRYGECDGNIFFLCVNDARHKIVSFDVELEKFRFWKGPNMDPQDNDNCVDCLLTYGDTVAYAKRSWESNFSMWVLRDKVNEEWVNELNIDTATMGVYPQFINFHNWINYGTLFGNDEYFNYTIYDAKHKQFKPISLPYSKEWDGAPKEPYCFYPYLGSLVSPKRIVGLAMPNV